jgi:SAM-dependent methyltransferase
VDAAPAGAPAGLAGATADRLLRAQLGPLVALRPPPADVIDLGAGAGARAASAGRLGYRVTALEPDPLEAERARALLGADRVIAAPLERPPNGLGPFDAAIAWHVLEHVRDLDEALAAAAGLLRPGGDLVAAGPNPLGAEARAFGGRWHGWEPARHRWHLDAAALSSALRASGMADVRVGARGGWGYPAGLAYSLAPGLDPQVHPRRVVAGRALAAALVPVALAARAAGMGGQLIATARAGAGPAARTRA